MELQVSKIIILKGKEKKKALLVWYLILLNFIKVDDHKEDITRFDKEGSCGRLHY